MQSPRRNISRKCNESLNRPSDRPKYHHANRPKHRPSTRLLPFIDRCPSRLITHLNRFSTMLSGSVVSLPFLYFILFYFFFSSILQKLFYFCVELLFLFSFLRSNLQTTVHCRNKPFFFFKLRIVSLSTFSGCHGCACCAGFSYKYDVKSC